MDQLDKIVEFLTMQRTMSDNPASLLPVFTSEKKSRKRPFSSIFAAETSANLPKPTKSTPKLKRVSPAWRHYEANDTKTEARCLHCKKDIKTKNSSTTGLMRHLKSVHNINCQEKQALNDENAPPQSAVDTPTTPVIPAERAELKPSVRDSSFDNELAELIDTVAPSVSCPKDKLVDLISRLHAVYVAIKDFPMLGKMMMTLMDTDADCDLDTALTHKIAVKYSIATTGIEDASSMASSIFLGTIAFDNVNVLIQYGAIGGKECFFPEDRAVIEQVCDQLIASD